MAMPENTGIHQGGHLGLDQGDRAGESREGGFGLLRQAVAKTFPLADVNYRESESGKPLALLGFAPGADPVRLELDENGELTIWVREDDMAQWQHYLKSR